MFHLAPSILETVYGCVRFSIGPEKYDREAEMETPAMYLLQE